VKYSFITRHKNTWPISLQCRVLGVTSNGYYSYWVRKNNRPDDPVHEEMIDWVKDIAESSRYSYGSRRMKKALNALCFPVSRNKARKLMREAGVKARQRKKFKVTTNSNHKHPVFENLLERQFDVPQIDRVYASDVTYIWTQEGWLYLAVVIDLCSRKVVGWSMSSRMKAQLVCDALMMAIWLRRPKAGLVVHSDRGSQYASKAYRQLLKAHGFIGSMSRKELQALTRGFAQKIDMALGVYRDIPAPDVYTNPQVMAWMSDEYNKAVGEERPATFTGKPIEMSTSRSTLSTFNPFILHDCTLVSIFSLSFLMII